MDYRDPPSKLGENVYPPKATTDLWLVGGIIDPHTARLWGQQSMTKQIVDDRTEIRQKCTNTLRMI